MWKKTEATKTALHTGSPHWAKLSNYWTICPIAPLLEVARNRTPLPHIHNSDVLRWHVMTHCVHGHVQGHRHCIQGLIGQWATQSYYALRLSGVPPTSNVHDKIKAIPWPAPKEGSKLYPILVGRSNRCMGHIFRCIACGNNSHNFFSVPQKGRMPSCLWKRSHAKIGWSFLTVDRTVYSSWHLANAFISFLLKSHNYNI